MRIAINALGVLPNISGGGETYVKGMVRGLAEAAPEHQFLLFVTRSNQRVFEGLPANVGFHVARIQNRSRPLRVLYEQMVLPSRIRAWKADASFFPLNLMPLTMARQEKTVLCIHNSLPSFYMERLWYGPRLRNRFVLWLARQSAQRSTRLITVSYFAVRDLAILTSLPEERFTVVSPGISSLSEEIEGAADLRLPTVPYVLLVGRPNKYKNFDGFIRAFADARQRFGFKHHVVIAGGEGTGQQDLERAIAETGVQQHVHLPGHIRPPELALLYASADAFVLPSLYESFGFPLLEALEFGIPSIASGGSALPEVGADAVLYVPPDNHDAMVETLGRLLSDPQLRRMLSERGKVRAQQFSWQIAARMLLSIIDDMVRSDPE